MRLYLMGSTTWPDLNEGMDPVNGMLTTCSNNAHAGVQVEIVALAIAGDARTLVALPALVVNGVTVHPRRSFRVGTYGVVPTDGLDEDALGDLLLDHVCNDDTCTA